MLKALHKLSSVLVEVIEYTEVYTQKIYPILAYKMIFPYKINMKYLYTK